VEIEEIAKQIVDSAIKVHRTLGAGLLESAYQTCLARELSLRGLKVECEVMLPIVYEGAIIDNGFRVDMIVNDLVIIENKMVEKLIPIHHAQILTYLRLSNRPLGFLLNWNTEKMVDGIKRKINTIQSP